MVYTIYVKSYCPHSQAAVKSAKATREKCSVVNIDEYSILRVVDKLKTFKFMKKSIIHNTVPIVFYNSKYIGGNNELQQKLSR